MKSNSLSTSELHLQDATYSPFSKLLFDLYGRTKRLRPRILRWILSVEKGEMYSGTLRAILIKNHGVNVGTYSYGTCCKLGAFPRDVNVGRYCSIAGDVRVFLRNHPFERLSMHPFFYNRNLGIVTSDTISSSTLTIGHDAWIGQSAIITPGCNQIGIGSVVAAGAVVTRDVPDFAIVGGNPAKIIRFRFPEHLQKEIIDSRWFDKSIDELSENLSFFQLPLVDLPNLTNIARDLAK